MASIITQEKSLVLVKSGSVTPGGFRPKFKGTEAVAEPLYLGLDHPMATISLALDVFDMRPARDGTSASRCPCCGRHSPRHQPDPDWPDRLVGTCEGCRSWFIIDTVTGLMLRLPGEHELRGG